MHHVWHMTAMFIPEGKKAIADMGTFMRRHWGESSMITTAFVTGAASGIGRAVSLKLARDGVAVYLTDVDKDGLAETAKMAEAQQVAVYTQVLDVADRQAFDTAAADAIRKMGRVDLILNNAGVNLSDTVQTGTLEDEHWVMDIDYWGVVHGSRAVLDHMISKGSGHIVNISSLFGLVGVPNQSAYCAAKHAVKGFTESLYYELLDTGVSVHCVHPGGINTNIVRNGRHKTTTQNINKEDLVKRFADELAITSPDQAAEAIMAGVERGDFKILVGKDARFADRFARFFPKLWRRSFAKRMKADL